MGWFGKIAGGAVGLLIGGPLGAILGAVLGHAIFDKRQAGLKEYRPFTKQDETQAVYFLSLFSILGKLSKIDGIITRGEIEVAERFMDQINLSGEERLFAIETFNQAKNSQYSFENLAAQFYQINRNSPEILRSFISLLFRTVAADGELHPAEESALERIRRVLRISDQEFHALKMSYFDDFDRYFSRLNCSPKSSNEEIKRNYKKLAKDFHPDKIISKGLPEEFVNFATDQFQEILEAYEKIRKRRGF